jgi:hypothetical protein
MLTGVDIDREAAASSLELWVCETTHIPSGD